MFLLYLRLPEETAAAFDEEGWFRTGDIGAFSKDGFLRITDRKKDMIISGGSNIYPREIEEIISQHPTVFEVAVIGVPDDTWGEAVKALVVTRPEMQTTESEIMEYCKGRLAAYKKPKSVEFLSELPKNAYGKILKGELRVRCWHGRARKI